MVGWHETTGPPAVGFALPWGTRLERLGAVRPNPPAPSVELGRDPARSRKSNRIATRLGIGYGRAYPREGLAMVSCTRAPRFGCAIGSNDCG